MDGRSLASSRPGPAAARSGRGVEEAWDSWVLWMRLQYLSCEIALVSVWECS